MAVPADQMQVQVIEPPAPEDEARQRREQTEQTILDIIAGYRTEAEDGYTSGPNPREQIWRDNWDRYWLRYDQSDKAEWQSTHVMPEMPQFVDRWAASLREALTQDGRWYAAVDDTGTRDEIAPHIERLMDVILARCARTPNGHPADFSSFFEDQMKLGAMMMCSAAVTWKESPEGGYVACDSVLPFEVRLDPKNRNLYRKRGYEVDKHRLLDLARQTDDQGQPLYNLEVIKQLQNSPQEHREDRERVTGHSSGHEDAKRQTVWIEEWLCTLLEDDSSGAAAGRNLLIVVANERYIIRGPEPNPFWHGQDWLITCPMITVPFSVYGRSYAEDWADAADAFVEMTNLILDAAYTSSLRAYTMTPDMLDDPTQAEEGVSPNKVFRLAEGAGRPQDFLREIELGTLSSDVVAVWEALKQEMREGAKLSEIALGQVPPKGDITATEVMQVSQSGSAMIRSIARTIEARFLEPILTLMFQTALQHMDFTNPSLRAEIGENTADMLLQRKAEFSERRYRFRVRGLSSLVDRQMKLKQMLSLLQTVANNPILLQIFLEKYDARAVLDELVRLFGVDASKFELSDQERLIRSLTQPSGGAETGSPPRQPGESTSTGMGGGA